MNSIKEQMFLVSFAQYSLVKMKAEGYQEPSEFSSIFLIFVPERPSSLAE